MKIVFFGCDDFALAHLARLADDGHTLIAVVTQPDKPKGRGMQIGYSVTKEFALSRSIEVFQPASLKEPEVIRQLKSYEADIFVVVAYGKFLPEEVLTLPKYFCVNVHPSLLPKYRGAAPVNWAVMNGDTETGVTLIKMDASMDGGDILAQEKHPLPQDITAIVLREQLAQHGAGMLLDTLKYIASGEYSLVKQDGSLSTRAPKMNKELGLIQWTDMADKIHNLVRGAQPWPGAYTFFRGGLLKINEVVPVAGIISGNPGEIVELRKEGFCVQAKDTAVLVRRVHLAGGTQMDARSFLAGHKIIAGEVLG